MAKVTIRIPQFDYTYEGPAEDEDNVWERISEDELGSLALDKAFVVTEQYDDPEEEEEEIEEEEA